jgi:hypothetical protein
VGGFGTSTGVLLFCEGLQLPHSVGNIQEHAGAVLLCKCAYLACAMLCNLHLSVS